MAMKIILESEGEKQVEITLDPSEYGDKDWEKVCDEIGNSVSRELAIRWLGIIEDMKCPRISGHEIGEVKQAFTTFEIFPSAIESSQTVWQ